MLQRVTIGVLVKGASPFYKYSKYWHGSSSPISSAGCGSTWPVALPRRHTLPACAQRARTACISSIILCLRTVMMKPPWQVTGLTAVMITQAVTGPKLADKKGVKTVDRRNRNSGCIMIKAGCSFDSQRLSL